MSTVPARRALVFDAAESRAFTAGTADASSQTSYSTEDTNSRRIPVRAKLSP